MTDRELDDLYDALRDRLADYGQEPPAPLWANIRAQLPPPVAQPQLRRRRRWAPAALLVVLLAVMSGAGWQWWHTQQRPATAVSATSTGQQTGFETRSAARGSAVATPDVAAQLASAPVGTSAVADAASGANGPASQPASDAIPAGALASSATAVASVPGISASAAPITSASAISMAHNAGSRSSKLLHSVRGSKAGAVAIAGTAHQPQGISKTMGSTGFAAATSSYLRSGYAALHSVSSSYSAVALGSRQHKRRGAALGSGSWATGRPAVHGAGFASRQPGNEFVANSAKITVIGSKSTFVTAAKQQPDSNPSRLGEGLPGATSSVAATVEAPSLQPAAPSSARGRSAAEASLLARMAALQLAGWPALAAAPQLVAVEPIPQPKPLGNRWAVQALVGPALTYRNLSTGPTVPSPTPTPVPNYSAAKVTTSVAELERPALGAGAQVSIRRALGPRWALSTGLGYTEYAIRLALQQVSAAADTAIRIVPQGVPTSFHRRDTYRFVTVPLRVAYIWTLTGRWRVGALAGADAAFYVGGSSTEGSTCACQAQTWGFTGSPYRRLSLGASLGAEVRYRLTERWELLAQPTASYLLSPLSPASAGYSDRHLFGGTALLGASFDLP